MSVTYSITRWLSPFYEHAAEHVTFKRRDAARRALHNMTYNMLSAEALLDRPVALRVMQEAHACEVSPPARGHWRTQDIGFHSGCRGFVRFEARRD